MDPAASIGPDELLRLLRERSLPAAMRGYDREATDRFLSQVDQGFEAMVRQQEGALARVRDLEQRLAEGLEREKAVTEAMVLVTKIRADREREDEELRNKCVREGEAITKEARRRSDEILKEAESQAQSIIGDAQSKARVLVQRVHDREELAERIQAHLRDFLQSMLAEVERRNQESVSIVGDLLARAGQAAEAEAEAAAAPAGRDDGGRRESGTRLRDNGTGPGRSDRVAAD